MTNYVFVHGGFIGGWYWGETAALLEKGGHDVQVVEQMPSAGRDPASLGDLSADAACVRQRVESVGSPLYSLATRTAGWSSRSWPTIRPWRIRCT